MAELGPQIKFPDDPIEVINKKLDKFFWILFSVGFVFVVTLIVMVGTLIIDSSHFNSATYKEYSQKMDSSNIIQKANEVLLKQVQDLSEQDRADRETIIQLLKK